jgi:hypothetical protein
MQDSASKYSPELASHDLIAPFIATIQHDHHIKHLLVAQTWNLQVA